MKNAVTYLFIVFLASLIFYGGAGVNLITYCCGDCRTEGVAVLLNDTCCDVHEHNCCSTADEVSACDSGCCEEDCCHMERISFDWSSSNNPIVELQPAVTDLLSFASPLASLVPVPFLKEYISQEQDGPPVVCPRVYLYLLTSLLI
ncbi:hypothetical protein DXD68_06270 [Parabacteroides sp. TM07-1AC]|uniref:hypothetical protein n=1 Tax=Parabacteroides sp. TM07-1AC TaxID=2292363 RepID=UPI000EFF647A|nr:hypothetical protein [Parabacteroides sp. TM07-1AC]RHU29060.1 hypothetical protein DXD68_06270 [Parabacteroides sp. TM07-1AC]